MIIESMLGLGDNIYQRSFIAGIQEDVWLNTPWPQLYQDLPHVHFIKRNTHLRTQAKNVAATDTRVYTHYPQGPQVRRRFHYQRLGVFEGMAQASGLRPGPMSLPTFGKNPHRGQRYALIRPCTERAEWRAASRNCDPRYIVEAARQLRAAGVYVISVADLQEGQEWLVGDEPPADMRYHHGELTLEQLLSLTQEAWLVVGPVGWIVPACMAYRTPAVIIHGGQGGYNHPERLTTESVPADHMLFATPEPMCMCTEKTHACEKEITDFDRRFASYLASRNRDRL